MAGWLHPVLLGAGLLALPMVAHAGLAALLGDDSAFAFLAFVVLLAPGALLAWIALATRGVLLPLAGMMVMILAPWSVVFLPEVAPFGHVPVREAGSGRAGAWLPRGAAPRTGFLREVSVARKSTHRPLRGPGYPVAQRGRHIVVPLVPPGWDPAQPVRAVAMLDRPAGGPAPEAAWPAQGGLVPWRESALRQQGAREALVRAGLVPASRSPSASGRMRRGARASPGSRRCCWAMPARWRPGRCSCCSRGCAGRDGRARVARRVKARRRRAGAAPGRGGVAPGPPPMLDCRRI